MRAETISAVARALGDQAAAGAQAPDYVLRFSDLFNAGRAFVFPCDANGTVDIDSLADRARANYFYARTTIGREFSTPRICRVEDRGANHAR